MMISRLPRLILPNETSPSISETTAGFDGFRASNNSVTRGRPPVISPALPTALGILIRISPALTAAFSFTTICAPTGRLYCFCSSPFLSRILMIGFLVLSLDSVITFSRKPVCSSNSSRYVTPSITFSKATLPSYSEIITALYGSHSQTRSPFLTKSPSFKYNVAP